MSFNLISLALRQSVTADIYQTSVLVVLAEAADAKTKQTFIGQETIAERTRLSRRKVVGVMAELEGLGLISRARRYTKLGHRTSDLITINLSASGADRGDPLGARAAPSTPRLSARGDISKVHDVRSIRQGIRQESNIISGVDIDGSFAIFAATYPQPEAINAAKRVWRELVESGTDPSEIMAGLDKWVAFWKTRIGDQGDTFQIQHIRRASRWLSEDGWLDPVPSAAAPSIIAPPPIWDGPANILEAVITERDADFARSYLAAARFAAPDHIFTRTQYAADQLKKLDCLRAYHIGKEAVAA